MHGRVVRVTVLKSRGCRFMSQSDCYSSYLPVIFCGGGYMDVGGYGYFWHDTMRQQFSVFGRLLSRLMKSSLKSPAKCVGCFDLKNSSVFSYKNYVLGVQIVH